MRDSPTRLPAESLQLWDLASEGRWDEARSLYRWHAPLFELDTRVKLVQCIKLAMTELGHGAEIVRAPRLPLAGSERKEVLATIRHALATRPRELAGRRWPKETKGVVNA